MKDRGPELLAVVILFLVLAWVTVLARCWVRIKMIKAFAIDDWLLVTTLILFSIHGGIMLVSIHWGCGHHMRDLSVHQITQAMHVS